MPFSHPLARNAKIWPSNIAASHVQNLLVIVTTLELDPNHKNYNKDNVERLKSAAQEWISYHQDEANGYLLMNRLKDW